MYDDLSLDYTYDQSYDLGDDLDEEYAREGTDYQQLAYMHYA